jgi:hypothetical protein
MSRFVIWLRSPEAREIAAHLTPLERNAFVAHARDYGRRIARWLTLPVFACVLTAFYSFWLAAAAFVVAALLLIVPLMRSESRRMRELLGATEWARAHGIRRETLRLFSFSLTR